MSGFLGSRGFPGGGRQLAHPADWPLAELGKYVQEIFSEIDIQAPASFHDGSDGGDLRSGLRAADMQPIFAAECQRSNRSFAPVMPLPGLCRVVD
jgi:hypothetical protein